MIALKSTWFAEYDRAVAAATLRVKLSGIAASLDNYVTQLTGGGFTLESVDTPVGPALVGSIVEDGASPTVVAVPGEGGTIELLSYDVTSDELLALVPSVQRVDDAEWRAANDR